MPSPDPGQRPSGGAPATTPQRLGGRPFRPPTGMPAAREDQRGGALVSLAAHALVVALIAAPTLLATKATLERMEQGAGGPGPAGGGGGGTRGTGGWTNEERITFIRPAAPAPQPVAEKPPEPVTPPVTPPPVPAVTPPKPQPVAPPVVAEQTATTATPATTTPSGAGTGGGTGSDGTGGNGPGSGGGVGSGIGTGRGSGVGPGTGGGVQANYPPTPTEMFLPPFPVPNKVKGFHLIAEFDVDERGRVVSMTFTETRDGDYNRKLREVLRSIRFRPGTRPDGTPVRMKAQIEYGF